MKKVIINQREDNSVKNIKIKNYLKQKQHIQLSRNTKDTSFFEKSNPNISDNSTNVQIKNIKNILSANKTFYSKNNSKYFPIHLSSMPKTKKYIESVNQIKNRLKLNEAKTISEKTIYNNSAINSNKYADYRIYLQSELNNLTFYKNSDLNGQKRRGSINNIKPYIPNIKTFNINSKNVKSRNIKKFKLKNNTEKQSISVKEYKNISDYNKNFTKFKPKKILPNYIIEANKSKSINKESNENNKNDKISIKQNEFKEIKKNDNKTQNQFYSINLSKNKLTNILKKKINNRDISSIENKDDNEEFINKNNKKNLNKLKLDDNIKEKGRFQFIIKEISNNNNSNKSNISPNKDSIEKEDNLINKNNHNLFKVKKVIRFHDDELPKKQDYNIDDSPRCKPFDSNVRNNQINSKIIKNGGNYNNLNKTKSNKTLCIFTEEKKNIIPRNSNKSKTELILIKKEIDFKEINPIKKKIKFLNIHVLNKKKINKNNISFLNKININNTPKKKDIISKKVKKEKTQFLINHKILFDKIISKEKKKLEENIAETFHKKLQSLKNNNTISENMIKKYNKQYMELINDFALSINFNSYISVMNRCCLDENTINYITISHSFSSIYLPLVEISKKRTPLFLKGKLFLIQKKFSIFEDKKSKFIESKKNKKIFQNISLNYIYKELHYYNLNSIDINQEQDYLTNLSPRNEINSSPYNNKTLTKKVVRFNLKNNIRGSITRNISTKSLRKELENNLSLLKKNDFFDIPGKIKKNETNDNIRQKHFSRRRYKKFSTKISLAYFDLIQNITGKNKSISILKNLIKEGEVLLFLDYLSNNSKIDINSQDEYGDTFLILSIKHSLNKLSKILIDKGININIQNKDGNSALHYALSSKNFYIADILRKNGAIEDSINKLGYTPWDCIGKNIEIDATH